MSEKKLKEVTDPVATPVEEIVLVATPVEEIVLGEGDSVLLQEPAHIINEIIGNTNVFAAHNENNLSAILYLGCAQKYAMQFLPNPAFNPKTRLFAGIPVIFVEASYHVNLVQISKSAEPAK